MARSDNTSVIDDAASGYDEQELPEGKSRIVIEEEGVTTVIQGDVQKVRRRWREIQAEDADMTVGEFDAAVSEYPMPDPDENLVPANEFYDE